MALPHRLDNDSRKRRRNATEEESSEFTPLSKRINNLHLNAFPAPKPAIECEPKPEAAHKQLVASNERLSALHYDCSRGIDDASFGPSPAAVATATAVSYSPDLTQTQNPFYYESNRLLFELYQHRAQRQPSSSHFV